MKDNESLPMEYKDFFQIAFGNPPFDYQIRFATDEGFYALTKAPTGAGKTATIIGGYLWKRLNFAESVGRRLIYCLPMRTLVEQTRDVTKQAIEKLEEAFKKLEEKLLKAHKKNKHLGNTLLYYTIFILSYKLIYYNAFIV